LTILPLSYRHIVSLALPISFQALLTSSLSVVDIYMVSSLGAATVAAVGVTGRTGQGGVVSVADKKRLLVEKSDVEAWRRRHPGMTGQKR
jgi:outer membrane receptor protein involved in Fe transport